MAYRIETPHDTNPLAVWQKMFWFSLASPYIYGFAIAALMQRAALSSWPTSFSHTEDNIVPQDADSVAHTMDIAIGATHT